MEVNSADWRDTAPWFQQRRQLATVTAAVLFLGVFTVRLLLPDEEAITALFVFPISLMAMTHGLRAGVASGILAPLLAAVGVALTGIDLSMIGWLIRILSLAAVGVLLGRASDNLARAARQRRLYELAAVRHRQAVEVNDSLVQGMSAAKWSFEAGRTDAGLAILTDTIAQGQEMVSSLIREAGASTAARSADAARRPTAGGRLPSQRARGHRVNQTRPHSPPAAELTGPGERSRRAQ